MNVSPSANRWPSFVCPSVCCRVAASNPIGKTLGIPPENIHFRSSLQIFSCTAIVSYTEITLRTYDTFDSTHDIAWSTVHVKLNWSYNCFRFRARPRHHLIVASPSYLVSTCSICCRFCFRWDCEHFFAQWILEIVFHQPYSGKICTFNFGDRRLARISGGCRRHAIPEVALLKSVTRKHGNSRWNFVAVCSGTWDMPGGGLKYPPPSWRQTSQKTAAGTRVNEKQDTIRSV